MAKKKPAAKKARFLYMLAGVNEDGWIEFHTCKVSVPVAQHSSTTLWRALMAGNKKMHDKGSLPWKGDRANDWAVRI